MFHLVGFPNIKQKPPISKAQPHSTKVTGEFPIFTENSPIWVKIQVKGPKTRTKQTLATVAIHPRPTGHCGNPKISPIHDKLQESIY